MDIIITIAFLALYYILGLGTVITLKTGIEEEVELEGADYLLAGGFPILLFVIFLDCKTEEEAKDFWRQMHGHGMEWCTGKSYIEKTNYEKCKGETCYTGSGMLSSYRYYNSEGYEILEWSDYMQKEFTKADLEDGMVVEQRDGNMYLVLAGKAVRKGRCNHIDGYTDDLKWEGYTGGDIVKVYRITPESLGCIEDVFIKSNLELIWERTETKKMTIEEMRQKLEELTGEEIEVTA